MASASTGGSLIGRIGSYLQIVTKDPSSTAFVPLAEAYRQLGLLDDALEASRLGTNRMPHFSPGFSTMGRVLGQMGRIDEAMSAYARALSIDRQSQAALVGLARLHLVRGERDLAKKILAQAQEFHPHDEKIADMLNALDLPRPWAEIKQAVQIQKATPGRQEAFVDAAEPIATATLAEIYVKQGLLDKACKVYRAILVKNPENDTVRERMMQLQEQLSDEENAPSVVAASDVVVSEQVMDSVEEEAPVAELSPPIDSTPKDQSPLVVFKRWLTAIKQGRANV